MLKLFTILFAFCLNSFADSVEAPGRVFYKMPSGEIVTRNVTLEVPAMGQGQITLKGSNFSMVSDRFFSVDLNGRVVFYVIFNDFPYKNPGEIAVYRGTYTRGSNLALYYGEVFVGLEAEDDGTMVEAVENGDGDFKHIAGFYFEAEVPH